MCFIEKVTAIGYRPAIGCHIYFVLFAESTKFYGTRKPFLHTSVCDTFLGVRKIIAYGNSRTLEYEIFTCMEISAITVLYTYCFRWWLLHSSFGLPPSPSNPTKRTTTPKLMGVFLCVWHRGPSESDRLRMLFRCTFFMKLNAPVKVSTSFFWDVRSKEAIMNPLVFVQMFFWGGFPRQFVGSDSSWTLWTTL